MITDRSNYTNRYGISISFLQSDSLAPPWKSEGVLAPRLAAGEEGEEGGGLQASRTGLTLGHDPNSSFGGSGTSLSESWGDWILVQLSCHWLVFTVTS